MYAILYSQSGRKTAQTRKDTTMKKVTMNAIANVLSSIDFENKDAILAELNAEINRGADAKMQKWAEYDAVKSIVLDALSDTPVTIANCMTRCAMLSPRAFPRARSSMRLRVCGLTRSPRSRATPTPMRGRKPSLFLPII